MESSFRSLVCRARRVAPRRFLLALLATLLVCVVPGGLAPTLAGAQRGISAGAPSRIDTSFAATIERLSEPSGYFDTDNLISNEASYLHVISRMRALAVAGGAYIGVGPDQNYSYIAAIRPQIAFVIDIRRDNVLQHLMYKALFARSRNRMEYLCRWLGRSVPRDVAAWDNRPIDAIIAWLDRTPVDSAAAAAEQRAISDAVASYGVPLSPTDRATIVRFHREFVAGGLDLRFTSFGRGPRAYYPTLRQLILEHDLDGRQANYLVREDDWRFVQSLHARDKIIPLVGDLAGTRAFPALSAELRRRGERVSALYTSNVEFYLWREGTFSAFAETVAGLPRDTHSVIIRSHFGAQFGERHPRAVDGYLSTQLLQPIDDFVQRFRGGELKTYWDVVSLGAR